MIYISAEQLQKEETRAAGRLRPLHHQQLCPEQSVLATQGTENLELEKEHFLPHFAPTWCLFQTSTGLLWAGQDTLVITESQNLQVGKAL